MTRYLCLILTYLVNFSYCINRPVFKIVLTQKGFAQFLQYDIETPPIREFTFCTWLRVFDLSYDQSVFTYVANGNNRVIQMWLDSGGKFMKLSFNGQISSSTLIDMTKNTWRHICISYQSDFGAWAIYYDGRLASCEAAQKLYGLVLPSGGSIIIGYGITDSGSPNGLEGEIFGANMILKSTIERNHTIKNDPHYQQKVFHKNKIIGSNNSKYIVLNNITFDSLPDNSETTKSPIHNTTHSFIKFKSPRGIVDHDVGLDLISKRTKSTIRDKSNEQEIFDFPVIFKKSIKKDDEKVNFWNLLSESGNIDKLKRHSNKQIEQSGSGTQELPNISEFETPPPIRPQSFKDFTRASTKFKKPVLKIFPDVKEKDKVFKPLKINGEYEYEVSEVVQPPPVQENTKVYGQWTSSQFANSVLNYLKNVNYENKKLKKVPSTIPLLKLSDNFPYASDYKVTKLHPPFKIERRNSAGNVIHKRDAKDPEINVEIVNGDLRTQIIDSHAQTLPKNVEITNRGQSIDNNNYHRFYRNVDAQSLSETFFKANLSKPTPFTAASKINSKITLPDNDLYKNSNLMSILPFLKSAEYFFDEYGDKKYLTNNEMYAKSLSNTNKWHNIESYNKDYTPRGIKMESGEVRFTIDTTNKKQRLKLKHEPDNHKLVKNIDDAEIKNGQTLASKISNFSNNISNSVSILKYNHGLLSNKKTKSIPEHDFTVDSRNKNVLKKNDFNQRIKIGNALNERFVIGNNEENNKNSFVGGSEKIPNIHRYRSDIDNEREVVPPSLGPTICKNVETFERSLYVQPDGSVDVISLYSPVKEKNLGMEFIEQNYKKCSLQESLFEKNALLLIDWIKTPVRLFGGSYPKKTTDLCGFF